MEILQAVNLGCNLGIFVFSGLLLLEVFVFEDSPIDRAPMFAYWTLRVGLSATCAGALLSVLTLSLPQWTEIFMNLGLALFFFWAWSWFTQYKRVIRK